MATSAPVNIAVTNPAADVPFVVGFSYPTNGQTFAAPANIAVHAWVTDSNLVQTVQYFSGSNSIGIVTNTSSVLLTNTSAGQFLRPDLEQRSRGQLQPDRRGDGQRRQHRHFGAGEHHRHQSAAASHLSSAFGIRPTARHSWPRPTSGFMQW